MGIWTKLALLLYAALLSGCSIAMALNGHPEPNFDAFEVGSTRKQAEIQLGTPASSKVLENGNKEDTYKYEMGNSPNGARATLYFYYDLATIGLAEPIFSLIEVFQGHDEETQIVYGPDDRVVEIKGYRPPPPSPELKAAEEAQQQLIKRPQPEINATPASAPASQ
ncbi:hypothetical protein [Nitrospira moscoviensis]|uniref:Lipoprotein SmpA/OmlA domain-containing protein n=1 Tax=Nitrospira moscoviensis TaxID=42253 RepID=A0A0K2GJA1_NITMO|nr:hypothetical protein [Nitrospira moscoviensis]ALA60929.1 exported protein of unknown function [Nitrospira moscoviensis]